MGRVDELVGYLQGAGSVAIVCHDDPDPDSLASATALKWIAERSGVGDVQVRYGGQLSHQQNRAMVQQFGLELVDVDPAAPVDAELLAFVDHAIPGDHTRLPPETDVDVVIDHHQYSRPIDAGFVDLRPQFGATSTILAEYVLAVVDPPPVYLASLLLFAIHRERLDHVHNPTHHEYEAALRLQRDASQSMINQLYAAQISPATVNTIGEAIRNRVVRGSSLVAWVGRVEERDALPQAADYLVNLRDVENDLVFGIVDAEIHLSVRSQDPAVPLDRVIHEVVGTEGRAGGHEDMAGGTIPVDQSLVRDRSALDVAFVEPIAERFFEAVESTDRPNRGFRRPRHCGDLRVRTARWPSGEGRSNARRR